MADIDTFEKENGQQSGGGDSGFFGAHDYFSKNVLPDDIRAHFQRIKAPTPYANNGDQVFMLVRAGTGKMIVNGLEYALRPNTLINLGPFHRYRFLPDEGKTLEIIDSRMNCGTYVYMIANPYLKMDNFYATSEPPVVYLTGLGAEIANDAMEGLLEEMKSSLDDRLQLCFCYMTDLMGLITVKMPKEYFKKTEKKEA